MFIRFTCVLLPLCLVLVGCADSASTDTASGPEKSAGSNNSVAQGAPKTNTDSPNDSPSVDTELLAPGNPAPAVQLSSVVHGEPFTGFSNDKVHVVEFWATWCGPCVQNMPHISKLQEQYGPQVQFIGVTDEAVDTVSEFLSGEFEEGTSWKDMLKYSIALDSNGETNKAYMLAAQRTGIPCAFVVKSGTIAWIGHPAHIEKPLGDIVGGNWDVNKARQSFIQASLSREVSEEQNASPELTVGPGVEAPDVSLSAVVHGAPVAPFENGRIYVMEFWATWCGPCLANMPHISELQQKYGKKVQFIGVTDEDEDTVSKFLEQESPEGEKWSDVLKYSIAIDDNDTTGRNYMMAAGQDGIPFAFIVNEEGIIAWMGHPGDIDEPLAQIVSGQYDMRPSIAAFKVQQALDKEDFDRAIILLDALVKHDPKDLNHQLIRLQVLSHLGRIDEYNKSAQLLVKEHPEDVVVLNTIAWLIVMEQTDSSRDLDLAFQAASAANKATRGKNPNVLDTLARVVRERGDIEAAIDWQRKAVEAAPDSAELKASLARYEKELESGK